MNRFESWRKEVESVRKQLTTTQKKLNDSHAENSTLVKKIEEMVQSLKAKDEKLQEYGKFNDFLNDKLLESNNMIEKLQTTIRQESALKIEYSSFDSLHERIRELIKEKESLGQKMASMEQQLASYEKSGATMKANLARILEDNEYLEKCIKTFKSENERLETCIVSRDAVKTKIGSQFDELLLKIEKISNKGLRGHSNSDVMIQGLEKDVKSHKEKV